MRTTTMAILTMLLATTPALAALDCARVKEMQQQGSSPADIARTLGITTPDVQACLAGVVEERPMASAPSKLPLAPQRPLNDGPIRRAPDGQNE